MASPSSDPRGPSPRGPAPRAHSPRAHAPTHAHQHAHGHGHTPPPPPIDTGAAAASTTSFIDLDLLVLSPRPTLRSSLRAAALSSKLNVLLVFLPLGIVAGALKWADAAVFALNFVAIIPLASLLGLATEEIALRTNQTVGGLMNATFGNAIEMIISIIALREGLVRVVQVSLLGSILSNLLLVLGFCFLVGGLRYNSQSFNAFNANTSASLLTLTVFTMLIPAAFKQQLERSTSNDDKGGDPDALVQTRVLALSRGTAVLMLFVYIAFLFFQLKTHRSLVADSPVSSASDLRRRLRSPPGRRSSNGVAMLGSRLSALDSETESANGDAPSAGEHGDDDDDDDDEEEPMLTLPFAIGLLFLVTVAVCFASENLVASIEGVSKEWGLSKPFIGAILLPIVGNAAEHYSAVTFSLKNKMSLGISIAVGSSQQIALFVTPLLVLVGWALSVPMTLNFTVFEVSVLVVSVLVVNALISDGKSNWLEGMLLLSCYAIISIAFFVMPEM